MICWIHGINKQLRHADRLATIGQLAAGIAHEINEPLSGILGFARLAQKDLTISGPAQHDIEKITPRCMRGRLSGSSFSSRG
ncbi:MAG TPA: histidine kinase dimerization/phospho-acceptor domain-containing protein [Spirochaetota bacterium]|nr:histidine kinase dimerization/phospho-acceptor domain-containing protein [Spirochaetota bacterium]HPG51043.1 histidine kinase dimerization/phospho-acceptor domain-containing protein [Spirochaetota bacterium]HPN12039.1 histidine kinase dimerization/phospho-acceptor domain-containing protein [Spirochaetota bacterium]